jgi:hypothetical protein
VSALDIVVANAGVAPNPANLRAIRRNAWVVVGCSASSRDLPNLLSRMVSLSRWWSMSYATSRPRHADKINRDRRLR